MGMNPPKYDTSEDMAMMPSSFCAALCSMDDLLKKMTYVHMSHLKEANQTSKKYHNKKYCHVKTYVCMS